MTGWDITGCLSRICGKRVFDFRGSRRIVMQAWRLGSLLAEIKGMVWLDRRQSEFFRLFIL